MEETVNVGSLVIPGTYIRVQSEGLIRAGGVSSGNIGIVGTASKGAGTTVILSDYEGAKEKFGSYDAFTNGAGKNNLMRALELLFANGGRTIYARALDSASSPDEADFKAEYDELIKDDVNILLVPERTTAEALAILGPVLQTALDAGKEMMAIIGCDGADVAAIKAQVVTNDRIIMTAPGIGSYDAAAKAKVTLPATYGAAAVAGLISSLTPQTSPTNKILPGVIRLAARYSYGEKKDLLGGRVCVLEDRQGIRIVRGLTTDTGAFRQITVRRITDYAKAGMRKSSDAFIGKLNNARVRKALYASLDGFLTSMVQDEALIAYKLEVTASRDDEINGRAMVRAVIQPTFSIDFIVITLVLE